MNVSPDPRGEHLPSFLYRSIPLGSLSFWPCFINYIDFLIGQGKNIFSILNYLFLEQPINCEISVLRHESCAHAMLWKICIFERTKLGVIRPRSFSSRCHNMTIFTFFFCIQYSKLNKLFWPITIHSITITLLLFFFCCSLSSSNLFAQWTIAYSAMQPNTNTKHAMR